MMYKTWQPKSLIIVNSTVIPLSLSILENTYLSIYLKERVGSFKEGKLSNTPCKFEIFTANGNGYFVTSINTFQ